MQQRKIEELKKQTSSHYELIELITSKSKNIKNSTTISENYKQDKTG